MAPRACPAWIGPVGLDETNSTLTRRPAPKSRRPKSATPLSTTSRSTSCNQVCAKWKLTNPGPAMSTLSTCGGRSLLRRSAIDCANSRGLRPAFLAEASATLRRPVAVLSAGRPFEVDDIGQRLDIECDQGLPQRGDELVTNHRGSLPSDSGRRCCIVRSGGAALGVGVRVDQRALASSSNVAATRRCPLCVSTPSS